MGARYPCGTAVGLGARTPVAVWIRWRLDADYDFTDLAYCSDQRDCGRTLSLCSALRVLLDCGTAA